MIKVKQKINFVRGRAGRRKIEVPNGMPPIPPGRVPRISKLMALAIRYDTMISEGSVWDLTALGALTQVSQPRITQIMGLCHLAPDLQEELLHLPLVCRGEDPVHEKMLRPLKAVICWKKQRRLWQQMKRWHGINTLTADGDPQAKTSENPGEKI